jgi:hypothetical protein
MQIITLPAAPAVAALALTLLRAPGAEILQVVPLHTVHMATGLASSRLKQYAQLGRCDSL